MSLKAGFGGNCILGQEAANSTSENEEEGRRGKKKREGREGREPSLALECKIGYSMAQKAQVLT